MLEIKMIFFVLKFPLICFKSKAALKNLNLEGFVQSETLFDSAKLWVFSETFNSSGFNEN